MQSYPYSYLLPILNIGLKIPSISSSNIKIIDRKLHKKTAASTKRMGGIYAGLVFPIGTFEIGIWYLGYGIQGGANKQIGKKYLTTHYR